MSEQFKTWQLSAFSDMLDGHFTTVNQWFKSLESKRIHYVSRAPDGTRIYTEQDLRIGQFIKQKRSENWSLDGIFSQLELEPSIELRPFPDDFKSNETDISTEVTALLRKEFSIFQEQINENQMMFEKRLLLLQDDNNKTRIEERQQRITDLITENRIKSNLELEALEEWGKLPISERKIKVGILRREEDTLKRDIFIKKYVLENYPDRLRKEMNLEDTEY